MSVVTGNARFTDLSVEEQRVVAERISKLRSAPWRPFWCPDINCNGDPHPLLSADGGRIYAGETDLVGPNGEPLGFEDPDGRIWGERRYPHVEYKYVLLDPHWAHNHARADQRLPAWNKPWTLFAMSGRGTGKALALDTPIPTPDGWTTMGDIKVGDVVFDQDGNPTTVTFATEVQLNRDCYRVEFSDGSHIIADADHLWVTSTHQQRKQGYRNGRTPETSVVTTKQILETLTYGKRGDRNHSIWTMPGINLPDADLPIDPYTLGAWLGDGSTDQAAITIHDDDAEEMSQWLGELRAPRRKEGAACATYGLGQVGHTRCPVTGRMMANDSLSSRLRAANLLGDKHIPAQYMRASDEQRLALLQGLMDTDGHATKGQSYVEFCTVKEGLARQVAELALSLGQKAVIKEGVATLNGVATGPKYRVTWTPTRQVFRLKRKAERLTFDGAQSARNKHRMITAVTPVDSVPVRCITVDAPTSTYLAGEQMIVTHNTTFGVEFVTLCARKGLDGAILGRRGTEIINTHVATLIARAHPEFKPEYLASKDLIVWPEVTMPDGTTRRPKTFLFSAEKPENIRSINISYTWVDEAAFMDEIETAWMNLKMATRVKVPGNPIHHLITSTPTPTPWVKKMEDEAKDPTSSIEVRRVSTYANAANLDPDFLADLERDYEGTRMGRQELHGEVLRDVEGAFWNDDMFQYIDAPNTEKFLDVVESMDIRITAVDPAGSKGKHSDETGIIAVGAQHFEDGQRLRASRFYALADGTLKGSPTEWAERAYAVARLTDSNYIVAEKNFGGDMVRQVLTDFADKFPEKAKDNRGETIQVKVVRAVQSKETRAEGTVGKYEQGRFYHVKSKHAYGDLSKMETEMVEWVPKSRGGKSPSPNRVDALVWAARECDTGQPYEAQGADLKSIKQKIKKGGAKKSALQRFN